MKSIKIIFTVVFCLTFSFIYAQSTSYKGVSVGRGISTEDSRRENVIRGNRENHFFTVHNSNDYPAKVKIEYIVGSKNGAWKMFEQYPEGCIINLKPREEKSFDVGEKIFGLKISYVHVDYSEEVKTVINGAIQAWEAAGQRK